ncbi:MAG: hypothetical protein QOE09_2676 [Ilumatobacteraceae bacterium]|jgi:hypothetical protein
MTDEDLPLNAELASAYLDDELDPGQRALAQDDPDVMSTVDSFSRVRALLSQPPAVDAGARSDAIAAALAEFDATQPVSSATAPATGPASATITSLQSRRMRTYRVLTRVAAALVIGVVGIAALNASRGNDSKSSSASDSTASADGTPQLKVAAPAPNAADSATAAAGASPIESASAAGPEIDSREALTQYIAQLEGPSTAPGTVAAASGQTAAAGRYSCLTPEQTVLAQIVFQGTPALAVRNQSSGALQAVATGDCRVLVHVP